MNTQALASSLETVDGWKRINEKTFAATAYAYSDGKHHVFPIESRFVE